ncbi:hypothetical protein [Alteromonas gracilis]|uniref:hypothetical protein n=1 Tax=Alteromonas gracilis TaxID=1479524 RepID=UPI003736D3F0
MDDELRSLQEKLRLVSSRLSNFALTKQNAEALCFEYRQLLSALKKFRPVD